MMVPRPDGSLDTTRDGDAPELGIDQVWRSALDHMLNGLCLCRAVYEDERVVDFVYVHTNKSFNAQTGLGDVIGRRVSEVTPGLRQSDPRIFELCARVVRTGAPMRFDAFVNAVGQWVEVSAHRPAPDHVIATFNVITERKRTQAVLEEASERYRLAFEAADLGFWRVDVRGTRMELDERARRHFGIEREAVTPSYLLARVHPDDAHLVAKAIADAHAPGGNGRGVAEHRVVQPSGEVTWVSVHLRVHFEGEGAARTPLFIAATTQDVTLARRSAEALQASEERYRSLVDNLDDVVFSTDLDGIITFVNPSVSRFGYRREEVIGRSRDDFMHPDDLPRLRELARREPPTHGPIEYRIVGAAGRVHTVRSATHPLVVGATVVGATGVIVDLTTQRETEEQLRAAQRMEAVGRLAGGVAHDFNNLLTVILSYTQLAKASIGRDDPLRGDLGEIERAAQRAESLTRQLLAFSRRQVLRPERVSLNDLVGGLSKMLQRLIGEHVELSVDVSPQLFDVQADRGQVEQVIMNLVLNARDAMPGGGRVKITAGSVTLDGARAEALQISDGPYAELSVIDTGHGMEDATRARIFEPFFTTKPVGKGTGLGLSMVYGLVKQSGGAVIVESEPGKGATFRVYLPRYKGESVESPRPASVHAAPGSETILFVEDEGALRSAASRMLSSTGYQVITAADAFEALRLVEEHGPRIRLVVTDVVMPGMNGRELADRLARLCPDLKVLFTSGYTDETIAEHDVLGRAFLPKPYEMRALTASVRRLLDEG